MLAVAGVVTLTAGLINGRALRRRLRHHHPKVWKKLGYSTTDTFWVKPENESRVASADRALWRFLHRGEFKNLQDDRLNALAGRQAWLIRAGVLLLLLFTIGLFIRT